MSLDRGIFSPLFLSLLAQYTTHMPETLYEGYDRTTIEPRTESQGLPVMFVEIISMDRGSCKIFPPPHSP